ncbi:hypothetical protein [Pilimelia terevasa]|nr:hypothetical protein [Pilimelia terevasa]
MGDDMSVPQIIGWAACVLCTSAFLLDYFAPTPPGGFSWLWFTLFTPGITLWAVQAFILSNPPLIVANSIVVVVLLHRISRILRAPKASASNPPKHAEAAPRPAEPAVGGPTSTPAAVPYVGRTTAMHSTRAVYPDELRGRAHPDDLRERATRMVFEAHRNPVMAVGAVERVAAQLGLDPEMVHGWVEGVGFDADRWADPQSGEAHRIAELERENRELRRANAILKSASAYFAAEIDRPSRYAELDGPVR